MKFIPWNADDPSYHQSKEQVHQKDRETRLHVETEEKMEPPKEEVKVWKRTGEFMEHLENHEGPLTVVQGLFLCAMQLH